MGNAESIMSLDVRVNGIKTRFAVAGEGDPVVLVHGGEPGAGGQYGWRHNIPALAQHFRVYAVDRIGFGASDKPPMTYSDEVLADHLTGFVDALCLEKVSLIGNSMGAYGVARYAVDHPDRMRKMVLVGTASVAVAMGLSYAPTSASQALRRANDEPNPETVKAMFEGLVHDTREVTDAFIEERIKWITLPGAQEAMRSMHRYRADAGKDPDIRERYSLKGRLEALTIPTIMVWGKEDRFAPIELGCRLRDLLPNVVAFHVLENAGHQLQHDQPERFNRIVIDFLRTG